MATTLTAHLGELLEKLDKEKGGKATAADRVRAILDDVKERHGSIQPSRRMRTDGGGIMEKHQLAAVMAADVVALCDAIIAGCKPPAKVEQVITDLRSGCSKALDHTEVAEGEPVLINAFQAERMLELFDQLSPKATKKTE